MNLQLDLTTTGRLLLGARRQARLLSPASPVLVEYLDDALEATEMATLAYRQWRRAQEAERDTALAEMTEATA